MTHCARCDRPHAQPITHPTGGTEDLCPDCTARAALEHAAAQHLHALLAPTLTTWARHWVAAGVKPQDLAAVLEAHGATWGAGPRDPYAAAQVVVRDALN